MLSCLYAKQNSGKTCPRWLQSYPAGMKIRQYIVDAFAEKVFEGNPAAICLLEKWLPDEWMQKIASENNLSETAFLVKMGDAYGLRWFTPNGEIDLCGHATIAAAHVVASFLGHGKKDIVFSSRSGSLTAVNKDGLLYIELPAFKLTPVPAPASIIKAIGVEPLETFMGSDMLCVLPSARDVKTVTPDLNEIARYDGLLFHITAAGEDFDCVSRTFAPKCGIPEDPVCGSGHCHIIPYWSRKLQKDELRARQASPRGGVLYCRHDKDRVILGGRCVLFSESIIHLDA